MLQTLFHACFKARLLEQLPEEEQFLPFFASSDIQIYPFQIVAASFAFLFLCQKGVVLCDKAGMCRELQGHAGYQPEIAGGM